MFGLIHKIFLKLIGGSRNDRIIRSRMNVVRQRVNAVEQQLWEEYRQLLRETAAAEGRDADQFTSAAEALELAPVASRDWLGAKTADFRRRLAAGESADGILPEVFAAVRFASWLGQNHRQFDVQLVAGQVLDEGWIAEEATGEGKTIACYPAVYMAALGGMKVHVVTVNDYLVKRDRDFAAPIFDLLGMTVGAIQQPMDPAQRQAEYACDIIYGTNSEFGFDYLRDNMKLSVAQQAQRGQQDYAVIDEVDNILIDEARTPLIISGPARGDVDRYRKADAVAREIMRRHRGYHQADRQFQAAQRTVQVLETELSRAPASEKDKLRKQLEKASDNLAQSEQALAGLTKYY